MTWAARLAALPIEKKANVDSVDSVVSTKFRPIGTIDAIDTMGFSTKHLATGHAQRVQCSTCGTLSRPFLAITNPDLWQCDTCLPADPNDQAYEATERAAIIAEGMPEAAVPHPMPVSWADAGLEPTPGAYCRNCNGRSWWCETAAPRGWRCDRCHPATGLTEPQIRRLPL